MQKGMIALGLYLVLVGCLPQGAKGVAEIDPTAAADAPVAGPDDPRPKPRPGKARAASTVKSSALEPPAASRTPDADDDMLPQPAKAAPKAVEEAKAQGPEAKPEPKLPDNMFQRPEAPPIPAALQGQAEQCTKGKGRFIRRGATETGAYVCVRNTKDANKRCDDSSDCEGICFAKSRTCAPAVPLFGCYDALEGGRVVNICVE